MSTSKKKTTSSFNKFSLYVLKVDMYRDSVTSLVCTLVGMYHTRYIVICGCKLMDSPAKAADVEKKGGGGGGQSGRERERED